MRWCSKLPMTLRSWSWRPIHGCFFSRDVCRFLGLTPIRLGYQMFHRKQRCKCDPQRELGNRALGLEHRFAKAHSFRRPTRADTLALSPLHPSPSDLATMPSPVHPSRGTPARRHWLAEGPTTHNGSRMRDRKRLPSVRARPSWCNCYLRTDVLGRFIRVVFPMDAIAKQSTADPQLDVDDRSLEQCVGSNHSSIKNPRFRGGRSCLRHSFAFAPD